MGFWSHLFPLILSYTRDPYETDLCSTASLVYIVYSKINNFFLYLMYTPPFLIVYYLHILIYTSDISLLPFTLPLPSGVGQCFWISISRFENIWIAIWVSLQYWRNLLTDFWLHSHSRDKGLWSSTYFVCLSICSRISALLSPEGFSWNFIMETFMNICRASVTLVKVGQKYRTLYVRFVFAGYINLP